MRLLVAISLFSATLCASFFLQGCAPPKGEDVKAKLDDKVYKIIDSKWQDNFGGRVNYKVSDVNPGPNDVQIDKFLPRGTVLTLPRAVAIATAHNRSYQLEKENLYVKALDLRLARHQFEPLLTGTGIGGYAKEGAAESVAVQGDIGMTQMLSSGTLIAANLTMSWLEIFTGQGEGGLSSIIDVAITQPLLRGSDPNVVLENLTQAERDTVYQMRSFNRFRKTMVVSIITQYYQVLQFYDDYQNACENYDTLSTVYQRAENLAGAGRLPLYELDQAKQDLVFARDIRASAQKEYTQMFDSFKLSLSVPTEADFELDINELAALQLLPRDIPYFSEADAIDTALVQRLDLANKADAVADAERKIVVALDNLRPQLDIGVASSQKRRIKSLSDPVGFGRIGGMQLDMNLDRVLEENEYRKTLIFLEQQHRAYEEGTEVVILEIRSAYRDLLESEERYRAASEGYDLAKQRFTNALALLEYGRANTRDVLDAQRDKFTARDDANEALVNYAIATLSFYRDTELLQVRPDGMWRL
jgi:outer membrane protein TolC